MATTLPNRERYSCRLLRQPQTHGTPVLSRSQPGGVITVDVNAEQVLDGTVTVIYIFGTVPNYASDYPFRVTSDVPPDYHLSRFAGAVDGVGGVAGFDDGGDDYIITVYPARDGTGSVELATLFKDDA